MSKTKTARSISPFAETEIRLARSAIQKLVAAPRCSLKDALVCIGEAKSHLDRAGVFHEMFNPFPDNGVSGKNDKKII